MALFYLVDSEKFNEAAGQDPSLMSSAEEVLLSAIERSQLEVQAYLDTDFQAATRTDIFHMDDVAGTEKRWFRLRLSAGGLRSAIVDITTSDEYNGTYTAIVCPTIVDTKRGLVSIQSDELAGAYIKVVYDAGYKKGDSIPTELVQGIMCILPRRILNSTVALKGQSALTTENRAMGVEASMEPITAPFHRRLGNVYKPISTATVPLT